MTEEIEYRVFLVIVAIVQNAVACGYMRKARTLSTIFQRREEGVVLTTAIGVAFVAYCVAVIVYLVNPSWMAWSAFAVADWIRWLGAAPLLAGSATILWGVRYLGTNLTFSVSTRADHTLVTSGPYRRVRHPLYSGLLLGAIGVSVLLANGFVAATGAALWLLLVYRTRLEEANLIRQFGDAYREYMAQTGRFWPRLVR